jgi:hypothetical protein
MWESSNSVHNAGTEGATESWGRKDKAVRQGVLSKRKKTKKKLKIKIKAKPREQKKERKEQQERDRKKKRKPCLQRRHRKKERKKEKGKNREEKEEAQNLVWPRFTKTSRQKRNMGKCCREAPQLCSLSRLQLMQCPLSST